MLAGALLLCIQSARQSLFQSLCSTAPAAHIVSTAAMRLPITGLAALLLLLFLLPDGAVLGQQVPVPILLEKTLTAKGGLAHCLRKNDVIVFTGNDTHFYDAARQTFSKLFQGYPAAVAYPKNTEQVQIAMLCAMQSNVVVHPRCGGHANEGETVSPGALTLDLRLMNSATYDKKTRTATVQAGNTAGMVLGKLWDVTNGTRGFPVGQRPTVGASGFILGGGFGASTRYVGLGCDQVISMKAVDSTGNIIKIDKDNNPGLLWALRGGGGGNLVVVTEFTVRTFDVSQGLTAFSHDWPWSQAADVLAVYQKWPRTLDSRFTPVASPYSDSNGTLWLRVEGWCYANATTCRQLMLNSGASQAMVDVFEWEHKSFLQAFVDGIGWDIPPAYQDDLSAAVQNMSIWVKDRSFYKYKTMILEEPLPREAVQKVLDFVAYSGGVFEFQSLGGAMDEVPLKGTAAQNLRSSDMILILKANDADSMEAALDKLHQATGLIIELSRYTPSYKAYINFMDTDVPAFANWEEAYYGATVADTLRCIKAHWDPWQAFDLPLQYGTSNGQGTASRCYSLLNEAITKTRKWSEKMMDRKLFPFF